MAKSGKRANQLLRAVLVPAYLSLPLLLPMNAGRFGLALALIVAGVAWRVWANGHVDKGERVCQEGPYALCRNPMYLGTLTAALGYFSLWGTWGLCASLWLTALLLEGWRAHLEAERLGERFGEAYASYRRRTPMFLPRPAQVVRLVRGETPRGRFSLRRLWDNGEVHRVVHVYACVVALWVMWERFAGPADIRSLRALFVRGAVLVLGPLVAWLAARAVPRGLRDLFAIEFNWHAGRALLRSFSLPAPKAAPRR